MSACKIQDLTPWSQAAALARLDRTGAMTTAELARAEMVKPQSMGSLLAELEQEGLVQRQRHAAKLAWLTAEIDRLDADEQRTLRAAIALVRRLGES